MHFYLIYIDPIFVLLSNQRIMKKWPYFSCLLLLPLGFARPCSMFKITLYGKTMVGNNEDAWRIDSRIWFEKGEHGNYGAAYVGHEDWFPQGGLNEAGLAYDGFKVYGRALHIRKGLKKMGSFPDFLKSILRECATVRDVQRMADRYDRRALNGSMLLYVDRSGEYLVVEADTTILGHDEKYVLSNFCPSVTPNLDAVPISRYQRGRAFLRDKADTSLRFCTAVMDTMHECRPGLGDGTAYTSIYDLNQGLIYLYFYHDFRRHVTFDLKKELAKGNHMFIMHSLFPPNSEYIRLTRYKTPFNSHPLEVALVLMGGFMIITLPLFLIIYLVALWRQAKTGISRPYLFIWPLLLVINLAMTWYAYNLLSNHAMYYFPAPYKEEGRWFFNLSAWFPLTLLLLFVPITIGIIGYTRRLPSRPFARKLLSAGLFGLNGLVYGVLLCLFGYWGFYAAL